MRYEISRDKQVTQMMAGHRDGQELCIDLKEDSRGIAYVSGVYERCPEDDDGLWITAKVSRGQARFDEIEQYFVPEGTGRAIERMRGDISVEVSLLGGKARIVRLLDANLNPIDPSDYLE